MARRSAVVPQPTGPDTLPTPSPPATALALPDGSTAEIRGQALEIRDREGCLMVRYADGIAEISAPHGDLRLSAPAGRVVIASGLDVAIEAGRDVVHRAGRRFEVSAAGPEGEPQLRIDHAETAVRADQLHVQAHRARAVIGQASLIARAVATTADRVAISAGEYEIMADRLVERARDSLREIADLAESRVGRVRAWVRGVYSLTSRRTVMVSSDDTSIDGSRINLG